MLDKLNVEDFTAQLNQPFQLSVPEADLAMTLELAEVKKLGATPEEGDTFRQAFSLLFLAPAEPLLDQQIVTLEHAELGSLSIFLVPVGSDKQGRMQYEAVFT